MSDVLWSYTTPRREVATGIVGELLITVLQREPWSDEAWREYCAALLARFDSVGSHPRGLLAYAPGANPTTKQRGMIKQMDRLSFMAKAQRIAVLTDSAIGRGVVTTLSWIFNRDTSQTKAFKSAEIREALAWCNEKFTFERDAAFGVFAHLAAQVGYDATVVAKRSA
jgi:hypothetical protein